jgi:hypothetical protein
MPHTDSRVLACLALALACFTVPDGAKASVGAMSGGVVSPFAHLSSVQTVQSGECWEQNGPDGPGYYPCGDGGVGGPIIGPAIRLHHRHGVTVAHPHASNPVYPGAPSRRVGAAPNFHSGAAPVSPGLAGVHSVGGATGVHVSAPASPRLTGGAGVHGPGQATGAHVGAPVSPGLAGVHAPGGAVVPHIGAPVSPVPIGVGSVHAGGAVGGPHIGAPAALGLAGVHGVGGTGGAFQGGGVGGVGHH